MMAKKPTWYDKGFSEALQGLPSDPPERPGHGSYRNYRAGYLDGEWMAERDADKKSRSSLRADCGPFV
jgi:hypothetical protein